MNSKCFLFVLALLFGIFNGSSSLAEAGHAGGVADPFGHLIPGSGTAARRPRDVNSYGFNTNAFRNHLVRALGAERVTVTHLGPRSVNYHPLALILDADTRFLYADVDFDVAGRTYRCTISMDQQIGERSIALRQPTLVTDTVTGREHRNFFWVPMGTRPFRY